MSVALVSLIQVNKDERESREKAERERLEAQQRDEIEKLAAEEKGKRSAVLIEWERTCSPPQSEEVCLLVLFILSLLIVVLMFMYLIIHVTEHSSYKLLTSSFYRCYRLFMRCGLSYW